VTSNVFRKDGPKSCFDGATEDWLLVYSILVNCIIVPIILSNIYYITAASGGRRLSESARLMYTRVHNNSMYRVGHGNRDKS